ncbi:MAG: PhoPQ-activated pathogenicity-related family protein [Tannerella sp.]|nr:PhoPQ-activated pathogenicity-related family protein [Tannerella sp.]
MILLSGLFWCTTQAQQTVTPSTALEAYLNNGDPTWAWEVRDSYPVARTQAYSLLLISQKWQGILWKHELIVFVPEKITHDGALLFITGSSMDDGGNPKIAKRDDATSQAMATMAADNRAVVALLRQVPNQPLYGGLTEDALISYTLNEFRKDRDYSWPLLFPMVKSARRAMDAVQAFAEEKADARIKRFVVTGISKRGWTTWLTGASQDARVAAIAPMVIDMLNMPATLEYQKELYGVYSEEIQDYVKLEIPQAIASEFGNAVVQMIDPYAYRTKLTLPKMIFMATNDPYWTIDAVKHYIDDIPGPNYLCYVPNAGHGLGDKKQAFGALNAFFGMTLAGQPYPVCEYALTEKGKKITLHVKTSADRLARAVLWTATSTGRDFRASQWTGKNLVLKNRERVQVTVEYPKKDFSAFYVELIYRDSRGSEYSITTRPYVASTKQVFLK